jgi:hypothetical protein
LLASRPAYYRDARAPVDVAVASGGPAPRTPRVGSLASSYFSHLFMKDMTFGTYLKVLRMSLVPETVSMSATDGRHLPNHGRADDGAATCASCIPVSFCTEARGRQASSSSAQFAPPTVPRQRRCDVLAAGATRHRESPFCRESDRARTTHLTRPPAARRHNARLSNR